MSRFSVGVVFAACGFISVASPVRLVSAQEWNDPRSRSLVEQATERRARQIADTALASYKAAAHGYLTFLAQVGEGFTEPPKIVKADELALEVYWHAPNLSKQLIAGRRDTLLLPTDINYHRDHLGIVQNNFPNIIRLGDGDEVTVTATAVTAPPSTARPVTAGFNPGERVTKSRAGPRAMNTSCSRTIAINPADSPSAKVPAGDHALRTCSQTDTNTATLNAEQACEKGGATYM